MSQEIVKETDYTDDDRGWAQRWTVEMKAADDFLRTYLDDGTKIVKRYRGKQDDKGRKLHLFHSDIKTKAASLYGNIPQVEVGRRFGDANDDIARVGGEMVERLLNSDIEKDSDSYKSAIKAALDDYLKPGFGCVILRYVVETESIEKVDPILDDNGAELAPEVPAHDKKTNENVHVDYKHWRDVRWPPCRVWMDLPWIGFKSEMTRDELVERFPEHGKLVPLNTRKAEDGGRDKVDPWSRADVWEIWHKERREVFWWVKGYDKVLDRKDDTLGLDGFWPCPEPMFANLTTDELIPTPDFNLSEDQYDAIDDLYERMGLLEDAIRVAGLYDSGSEEVKNLLNPRNSKRNGLYPADNWAMFAEKGGVKGAVDWLPLDMIVAAHERLKEALTDKINLLHQINGIADIMRGGATQSTTATEQSIKAKFGSIRMQAEQQEFARFASDCQRLKAEIISKHFEPETIIQRSNVEFTADAELAPQAVQLIKDRFHCYRIEVKSDQISMTDYAALKQERVEVIQALPTFFQAMVPVAQAIPGSTELMFELIKWGIAGLRGSSGIEGVIDQAMAKAKQIAAQPKQPPPPDPKIVAAQMKAQGDQQKLQAGMQSDQMKHQSDMMKIQATTQADLARINAETQAEVSKQAAQATFNVKEEVAKAQIKSQFDPPHVPGMAP